jgi:hypothetical protein
MVRRALWLFVSGGALLSAGVLIDRRFWNWPWGAVGSAAIAHIGLIVFGGAGIALLTTATTLRRRARLAPESSIEPPGTEWPWPLTYTGVATIAAAVTVLGVIAFVIMLQVAGRAAPADRPALQIDAIKYGLGLFAAGGAVAALLLGIRRQQHSEHAQAHTELDASERRVTDLYTKAVEQLGHADAAVRLGGLYALERVAQNNLAQRQTVINVLCAYLRMPFTPPVGHGREETHATTPEVPEQTILEAEPVEGRNPNQELQVRLTAQRIIIAHLTVPTGTVSKQAMKLAPNSSKKFWPDIDIDLVGATLIGWDMRSCWMQRAEFTRAFFVGRTSFNEAVFGGKAEFSNTTFSGDAWFLETRFTGDTLFEKASFIGDAYFGNTTFASKVMFHMAAFTRDAMFSQVTFDSQVYFVRATFAGHASFRETTFTLETRFDDATFTSDVWFDQSVFANGVWFGSAIFTGDARFDEATFAKNPGLGGSKAVLRDSRTDVWPTGWRLEPVQDGIGRLVQGLSTSPP